MDDERFFYSRVKVYPTIFLTEADVVASWSPDRRTIRTIRRYHKDSPIRIVVLEIDLLKASSHSKSLLETIEGLPRQLKHLTWIHVNGARKSMVLHTDLTNTDKRELERYYRLNRGLESSDRIQFKEQAEARMVRLFLKQREINKLKRE